jgi:ACS family hexuronate transporter-like MFS transporter
MGRSSPAIPYSWVIVCIVWLSGAVYFLSYMTIGTLAPFIKPDLELSSAQVGLLCSAITIGSTIAQIPAGIACDLYSPGRVMGLGLTLISGCAFAISTIHSYLGAFFFLVFLGLGVGCNQAPASKAIVLWFPSKGRATAMGVKQTGIAGGGILASVLLPAIAVAFGGWRASFQAAGLASLASAVVMFALYKGPPMDSRPSSSTYSFRREILSSLLLERDFILICMTGILLMIVQYSFSTYFILYTNVALGFAVDRSGLLLALAFAGGAMGRVGWSMLSDYVFGARRKVVLILIGILGAFAASGFVLFKVWNVPVLVYVFTVLFGLVGLGWNAVFLTIAAEFPGDGLAGTATGMVFLISNMGVIIGPPLFGLLIDLSGTYTLSWLFLALCMLLVALSTKIRRKEVIS